ncbi:phosphoadenylyl-sulfate reductase [Blochmannia endosymbiont of Polyrhachis (Hedomyrma) turneri]|uniref:phosphoadenylyl-sulfate reductase n=1 Tax=Blochmannia endosymbiont of Polyrhachis (Hedomyrma) turneri TaxID=1505596 RepID=UPI00061A5E2C|nr:phosphoadenylyl-sulfate reductase [Blochmannia endosymbiont of Polyrhachis (Hedomyrma) turneri]AKC59744.1 Phosphoadenosine phosphosulfate reductase [Blochmannia endosymbiont of Polyrhachis (Hedomyrma) turneri]
MCDFSEFDVLEIAQQELLLHRVNRKLNALTAEDRVVWGLEHLPRQVILSSSFGIQSVVSLHLVTRYCCDIPVVFIDTGYLFPETYHFVDQLTDIMKLNLQVFSPLRSAAWQEARYGKLWERGLEGIQQYNYFHKIEPMRRALKILKVRTWFAGLRRTQSQIRNKMQILSVHRGVFKLLPVLDWDDKKVFEYIARYSLLRHPLWDKGYTSLGDVHTTLKSCVDVAEKDVRFFGLTRECGLHEEYF